MLDAVAVPAWSGEGVCAATLWLPNCLLFDKNASWLMSRLVKTLISRRTDGSAQMKRIVTVTLQRLRRAVG